MIKFLYFQLPIADLFSNPLKYRKHRHIAARIKNFQIDIKIPDAPVKIVPDTLPIHISVTDSGEGIQADQLPLIWDRYYKVDKTHKRATAGSGLGLSIVKQIVSKHNGSCGVTSAPNAGSTFWFELDLYDNGEK